MLDSLLSVDKTIYHMVGEQTGPERVGAPAAALFPAVPGYEILEELGRGGMGVVYKARQAKLNRIVALKMILSGGYASDLELSRFRTEAEAIARLHHPTIVAVYEIGEYEGKPFFSLEFCSGGSLDRKLKGSPLPPLQAAGLVETLARAMQAAHEKNVIHRDLKPANILLADDGAPKITDFGLAKKTDEAGQTVTGDIMGTPSYMAPEQASGKIQEISPATDVYALGAILYELLTGRPPFRAATKLETLMQVQLDEPAPPRQLQSLTPRNLEIICLKCLEKGKEKRYATAAALADDLRRFLTHEPIHARPASAWERAAKWARRRPTAAALVAALTAVVLALSFGGLFFGLYTALQNANLVKRDKIARQIRDLYREGFQAEEAGRLALERKQEDEAARQFTAADRALEKALTALDAETALKDEELRTDIIQRREEIGKRLEELSRREKMAPRVERLRRDRDDVFFHAISPIEHKRADKLTKVRRLAREALALWDISIDRPPADAVQSLESERERFPSPGQWKQTAQWCCEVLLAWSEAEAESEQLPAQPVEKGLPGVHRAMHLLEMANNLGQAHQVPPSQAYHLRRARCLAQLGDQQGAAAEKALAAKMRPNTALDHFLAALEHHRQDRPDDAIGECAWH